jgi:hypothetical protein
VFIQPSVQFVGDTSIEGAVGTFEDINAVLVHLCNSLEKFFSISLHQFLS